jgi:hypothetical protein
MRIVFCFPEEHSGEVKGKGSLPLPGKGENISLLNNIELYKRTRFAAIFQRGAIFSYFENTPHLQPKTRTGEAIIFKGWYFCHITKTVKNS